MRGDSQHSHRSIRRPGGDAAPSWREEAGFIGEEGRRLFAVVTRPQVPTGSGLVLCHPLGEEKLWAHRVLVRFCHEMAARGFAVIRPDFRGEGDSDLLFEESTLETRIEDVGVAAEALRAREPGLSRLVFAGLRLGATIAAVAASRSTDVERLVLWDPVVDGAAYGRLLLQVNLAAQLAAYKKVVEGRDALVERMSRGEPVNIEGYGLTRALFDQIAATRLHEALARFGGRTLVLQPGQQGAQPRPELRDLAAANDGVTVSVVPQQPFWKESKTFFQAAEAFERATIEWLEASE